MTFWTAAFPGLARDLPEVQKSEKELKAGIISSVPLTFILPAHLVLTNVFSSEEHASFESLQRNRISNVSFAVCSAGEILILAVMVGILKGVKSDESTENNTKAFSVLIAFSGGVWGK